MSCQHTMSPRRRKTDVFLTSRLRHVVLAASTAVAMALSGCTEQPSTGTPERSSSDNEDGNTSSKVVIVCTTTMITDAARIVGGSRVQVHGLMGAGVDPHLYQMSREDQKRLLRADVVLYHGLHLEGKMVGFLRDLERRSSSPGRRVVAVADGVPKAELIRNALFGEYPDPHIWFDLRLWKAAVDVVVRTLEETVPEHGDEFRSRGDAYLAELTALDRWARATVEKLPEERRRIVTSHDAYNYFGKAYGFDVRGLQGISTETDAGLKDIEEAVKYIRDHAVPVVFAETSVSDSGVQSVAKSSGARVSPSKLYSDALGEPGTPEGSLVGMFRYNLSTIVHELSAGAAVDTRSPLEPSDES